MQAFALNTLDLATQQGATYADVRVVQRQAETLAVKNGQPHRVMATEDAGFGVRVLADGAWGFASSSEFHDEAAATAVQRALSIARASAQVQAAPLDLPLRPAEDGTYSTPFEEDPFAVPVETRLALLATCCEAMQRRSLVRVALAHTSLFREHKWFVSSEGSRLEQTAASPIMLKPATSS
jgi:TldD protein